MSVNQTNPIEIMHTTLELRISDLEAGFKKHEELIKSIEDHTKQLNDIKTKLVRFICDF